MLQPKKKITKKEVMEDNNFLRKQRESKAPSLPNFIKDRAKEKTIIKMKKGGTKGKKSTAMPVYKKGGKKC